jgi:copper chaperone NosL
MAPMRPITRILVAIAALSLLALLVVPVWRIDLAAPQYPEGLELLIYADRFEGDVRAINGLNHYIGMAEIHNDMFPEFTYLPKVIIALTVLGLLAALVGKRFLLLAGLGTFTAFGAWALYDMYQWGYQYGHNLDPRAAIKIEDQAYQPPLLGHKQLLNFDAWSLPEVGGWILFGVVVLLALLTIFEYRWPRKPATN